jgi:uncharacterized membrane protein
VHTHDVGSDSRRARRRHRDLQGRARAGLIGAVVALVAATIVGLVVLWPAAAGPARPAFAAPGASFPSGTVLAVKTVPCPAGGSAHDTCGQADVRVNQGPDAGEVVSVQLSPDVMAAGITNRVVLVRSPQGTQASYTLQDLDRKGPLLLLTALFVLAVLAVARLRGALALVGLVFAGLVMWKFMLPALLAGSEPVWVALTASSAIMVIVLYLAHGLSARTTTALLGTFAGLGLTAIIATWAVGSAHLTGASNDESALLSQQVFGLSARDLLLCGILLAGLGVLNDVTITQSSAVWEPHEAGPHLTRVQLFNTGMRIGRDHIASTIYTIVFAYAGAALSVLMLIVLYGQPLSFTITSNDIAEEVVRTLASAIGLVLAVPITTALAVLVVPAATTTPSQTSHPGIREHLAKT